MNYNEYFDKVYGCWLGKCVCGNIGAPFEGMKQKLSLSLTPHMLEEMLPNDDLDLQVLFLDVVEERGQNFTSSQLAESFLKNCPYAPGEYAYFKKNFRCGIHPPLSGKFNNEVYRNGMGCAIRSELWACLAPAAPERAVSYCLRDGVLDHCGDGLYGEVFLTALESLAFAESDARILIKKAAAYIPKESALYRLIEDTVRWSDTLRGADEVRGKIISHYGSAEATSVYQNIGFILLYLLRAEEDVLQTALRVCECGFDTDCTCATLGAILGIMRGAEQLNKTHDLKNVCYRLGVNAKKRSGLVYDLSREIATLGAEWNSGRQVETTEDVAFEVEYENGDPSLAFGETKRAYLCVDNRSAEPLSLRIRCEYPLVASVCSLNVAGKEKKTFEIGVRIDEKADCMAAENLIFAEYGAGKCFHFGFCGARRFDVYGPFWKNNVEVPRLLENESYWKYFPADSPSQQMDKIRFYHTNCLPDNVPLDKALAPQNFLRTIDNVGDIVTLEDHLKFDGQAYYVFRHRFVAKRAVVCGLQAGYDSAFELYLNGELLIANDSPTRYTPENSHKFGISLREGENEVIVKIRKCGERTRFSFNFLESGACSDHITDFYYKK